jgi:hypothetical protein
MDPPPLCPPTSFQLFLEPESTASAGLSVVTTLGLVGLAQL